MVDNCVHKIVVMLLLIAILAPGGYAYIDTDESGAWVLESNVQMKTIGEEFVVNYKVPKTIVNDTAYITYTGFGTYDYSTQIADNLITAYKADVRNDEYLDRICAVLRSVIGVPEIVPSVDLTYYANKTINITSTSWTRYCWEMDGMALTQGMHYFGIKCTNCGSSNRFRFQTDGDTTEYYYYNGAWVASGESYNLWAETQWSDVLVLDNATLMLEYKNGTSIQELESFVSTEPHIGLEKLLIEEVGQFYIRLRNEVGSLMAEMPFWIVIPTEKQVLNSFNIIAEGVRKAEIDSTVEETWSFFNPFNVSFQNVNCTIYLLDGNFTKTQVDVEPFMYSLTESDSGYGAFRVRWFANSSVVQVGENYETRCFADVISYNRTYQLPEFSQYVHITRERNIWEKLLEMFQKILGIEQTVNETYALQNQTYVLLQEVNRTVSTMNVTASVNTTQVYEDTPHLIVPDVFDDGSGEVPVIVFLREGSLNVAGATCSAEVFSSTGTQSGTWSMTDKGDGVYVVNVDASWGDRVRVACTISDGKTVSSGASVKYFSSAMMSMVA